MAGFTIFTTNSENIYEESCNQYIHAGKSHVPKRTALAVLNNNTNSVQNKDGLASKTKSSYGNLNNYSKVVKASNEFGVQNISVFEDKENSWTKDKNEPRQNVVNLLTYNEFQGNLEADSLMALDLSLNEKDSKNDTFCKSPYDDDIYMYLREMEQRVHPRPTYMRKQPDITISMRCILVDWLVEVSEEYKLHAETLYLAVSYIDRFLSSMSVLRGKLQLVGTASIFIASKYEEVYPPELKDFVYVTDDTYTKKQVLRMEHLILKVLSFDLAVPTAYFFLQRFCYLSQSSEIVYYLSQYICELSLLEAEPFLKYFPSETAAASLALANYTLGHDPWSECLEKSTGYKLDDLKLCISSLYNRYSNISKHPQQAICEKYKSFRFRCVTDIQPPEKLMY